MADRPRDSLSRRELLAQGLRGATLLGVGGAFGLLADRSSARTTLWQIDPAKCVQCGRCSTHCVRQESAVKCVHVFAMCGYCRLCTGYFEPQPSALDAGAENQLCPTGAIRRSFVEDPYYQYEIDEALCVGCAKCVEGCQRFGNGSLQLQVRHDLCLDCNECSISVVCAGQAFRRVPVDQPYILKGRV